MSEAVKALSAIGGAGGVWMANVVASSVDSIPDWIDKYGLPMVFLGLTIYAIRALFQINQALQAGKDSMIRELLTATDKQTAAIEKLATELQSRPCGMPKQIDHEKTTQRSR